MERTAVAVGGCTAASCILGAKLAGGEPRQMPKVGLKHALLGGDLRTGFEGRQRVGIAETTIRFSVGLEDPRDLREDLQRGLTAAG